MIIMAFTVTYTNKPAPKKDLRPNIVLIMADDLGYSDLGCYGGEINTPNLDYLAANGLRFKKFYNTSRCCPSRAALLTGLYNHNAGIGEMTADRNMEGYRGALGKDAVTLAEVLKDAGYRTAMSGKWHVSNTVEQATPQAQLDWLNHKTKHPLFSPIEQYPTNRGFEKFFGTLWGVVDFFDPFSLVSGTTPINTVPKDYYHTDAISDSATAYIKEFSKGDKPFFLYVAQNAPHWPLQALPEDIEKYKDTYKAGWDVIRKARYDRMLKSGLIDSVTTKISPRINDDLQWEDNPDKEWGARAMAVHAAMIDRMDQGIGRMIAALKETGQLDNTLIVFLSDNGASPEDCSRYGKGFDRPGETRDGREIVYPVNKKVFPGPQTTFASIGQRWANVANTPYRFAKEQSYEGGVRTPMIAFWPKGITAKKGSMTDHTGHVMDFMATFADLAGAKYPEVYKGNQIKPMQGLSFAPAFKGKKSIGHEYLFNEHYNARSVRSKEWKMVSLSSDTSWHLYRVKDDESELNDLAAQYPGKVKELHKKWQEWALQNHVLPKQKAR
ncbi:arylsulfatase [Pedobacter psychroterrae]|uniref:Arylsulfatase n=2 Tax=Pedobacter psychroterrae TaxID=2530453 RepID=A0A4R0NJJ5_9SPHI|nr:arylsulfatase [Pedobacter psychroterrae]